jgi:hypothetical protein
VSIARPTTPVILAETHGVKDAERMMREARDTGAAPLNPSDPNVQ